MKKIKLNKPIIYLLIITMLPFCVIGFYSQPIAEDYGFSFQFRQNEFFSLLKNSYLTMNGRYMANIFMYLNPMSFESLFIYKLIPTILIGMLLLVNCYLINTIFDYINRIKVIIVGSVLTLLYLHNMPIISEGLYWYTASSIYFIGILFMAIFLIYLIKTYKKFTPLNFVFTILTLFIAFGFNEVQSVLILFILCCVVLYSFIAKGSTIRASSILIIGIGFCLIMVLAPGNSFRADMYPESHDLLNSLWMSLLQTGRFFLLWVFSIPILIVSILFYPLVKSLNDAHWLKLLFNQSNKWFTVILLGVVIFMSVFPPYYFTGILGQHRTLNTAYYVFILIWFFNLGVWYTQSKTPLFIDRLNNYKLMLVLLLFVGFIATNNGYVVNKDLLSGDAKQFDAQMNKRIVILKTTINSEQNQVVFNPIERRPKSLFVTDISEDPNYWTNLGYNQYFGVPDSKIYISKPTEDE